MTLPLPAGHDFTATSRQQRAATMKYPPSLYSFNAVICNISISISRVASRIALALGCLALATFPTVQQQPSQGQLNPRPHGQ
eukprot:365707-Chlamydomonas_euryale.AAC.24